jgi:hypothetical protein
MKLAKALTDVGLERLLRRFAWKRAATPRLPNGTPL